MNDFALRDLYTAFGMESSFGEDSSTHPYHLKSDKQKGHIAGQRQADAWSSKFRGPFQMSTEVQEKHGLSDEDVFSPDKAVGVYINETSDLMRNDRSWKAWEIDKRAKDLDIDRGLLRYLVWQQGRAGAIDIITAASHDIDGDYGRTMYKGRVAGVTSGKLGEDVRENMANNVSGLDSKNKSGTEYAQEYLVKLSEKWAKRKEESYDKFRRSPIEAVMNQGGKF